MTRFLKTGVAIFLLGAFIGTLAPSPVDPIHFWLVNYLFPTITNKLTLIGWQIFDWYILDALWWLSLLGLAFILHIKKVKTIKIITTIGILAGLGITIGILSKIAWGF